MAQWMTECSFSGAGRCAGALAGDALGDDCAGGATPLVRVGVCAASACDPPPIPWSRTLV